ncbi:hypothetical protein ACFL7M_18925 [Thermodesulfobacteriota bacterium]
MDKTEETKIEKRWKFFQEHLNYTDEETAIHKANPKHVKAMAEAPNFATHEIIIDIIEAGPVTRRGIDS